jgi:hypothetical protein
MRQSGKLLALALCISACTRADDGARDYSLTVRRSPEDVLAALAVVGSDVPDDSVMPYLAGARLEVTNPDPKTVRISVPGDSPDKTFSFTFVLLPRDNGSATDLHVTSDIPEKFGPDGAARKPKSGSSWAETMRVEMLGMVRKLDLGRDPDDAAGSFKMGMHILAQNNRRDLQDAFERVAADPQAYDEAAGRRAADRYLETSPFMAEMTEEQRSKIRAQVYDALDRSRHHAKPSLSGVDPATTLPGDVISTDR